MFIAEWEIGKPWAPGGRAVETAAGPGGPPALAFMGVIPPPDRPPLITPTTPTAEVLAVAAPRIPHAQRGLGLLLAPPVSSVMAEEEVDGRLAAAVFAVVWSCSASTPLAVIWRRCAVVDDLVLRTSLRGPPAMPGPVCLDVTPDPPPLYDGLRSDTPLPAAALRGRARSPFFFCAGPFIMQRVGTAVFSRLWRVPRRKN
mmetsp:Transcript_17000/g.41779  ORF Transcript_17000/g.41779 Transcript_17000/m.41779 type:complete len:200 (-) Transcript_17000:268-867(-)